MSKKINLVSISRLLRTTNNMRVHGYSGGALNYDIDSVESISC